MEYPSTEGTERHSFQLEAGVPELDRATELTAAGFVQSVSPELRQDVANHLEGAYQRTITINGKEAGYAVFDNFEVTTSDSTTARLLYLRGIIIEPGYQGRHVAGRVIDDALTLEAFSLFAFRTQSSIMYAAASRRFAELYPSFDQPATPADIQVAGECLGALLGSDFPLDAGCYGGPLYGEKPIHRDPEFQEAFDRICPDFYGGDAVLCIARKPKERP